MKKIHNVKWFTLGMVVCLIITMLVAPALATKGQKQATLDYTDIKITLDGKEIIPKDANGNIVEPFAISGTTYLPVRAISSALGLDVAWDSKTSTVVLQKPVPVVVKFTLSAGQYVVGEDIAAGKYDCVAVSGSGNFTGKIASLGYMSLNEILGAPGTYFEDRPSYSNLRLANGDSFTIGSDLVIEFTLK